MKKIIPFAMMALALTGCGLTQYQGVEENKSNKTTFVSGVAGNTLIREFIPESDPTVRCVFIDRCGVGAVSCWHKDAVPIGNYRGKSNTQALK